MLYKIDNGLAQVKCSELEHQTRARRTHGKTLKRITGRPDYRVNSVFPRTVREWNDLFHETVDLQSLNTFIVMVSSQQ